MEGTAGRPETNQVRGARMNTKWNVSASFAKGCVHITNSKQRKRPGNRKLERFGHSELAFG